MPTYSRNPDFGRNLPHQPRTPGDDVEVVPSRQDGNTTIFGNWSWESQNAVDGIRKIHHVTDVADSSYPSIPNFREVHRTMYGAFAFNTAGTMPTTGAFTTWANGWTAGQNYINTASFGTDGAFTCLHAGTYEVTLSGSAILTGGGGYTAMIAGYRVNSSNFSNGASRLVLASGAACTQAPLFLKWYFVAAVNDIVRPVYFQNYSAGTSALDTLFWRIRPLFFDS